MLSLLTTLHQIYQVTLESLYRNTSYPQDYNRPDQGVWFENIFGVSQYIGGNKRGIL